MVLMASGWQPTTIAFTRWSMAPANHETRPRLLKPERIKRLTEPEVTACIVSMARTVALIMGSSTAYSGLASSSMTFDQPIAFISSSLLHSLSPAKCAGECGTWKTTAVRIPVRRAIAAAWLSSLLSCDTVLFSEPPCPSKSKPQSSVWAPNTSRFDGSTTTKRCHQRHGDTSASVNHRWLVMLYTVACQDVPLVESTPVKIGWELSLCHE
mmetsp:Transcript_122487/g.381301  ORF Transcript_122487/g.381301 Transcript_122487/m.381301 type:complete len:211 (+) Transcript_122487:895-1527(+)